MADCLAVDCGRASPPATRPRRSYAGVDLMAHDFDSLLRAMLDEMRRVAPERLDRSEADAGMMLLELFAYAGDQLAYLQDRVALEGYLGTATQYESVRKLLRLIDYTMDPGRAAETTVLFEVVGIAPFHLPRGFAIATATVDGGDAVIFETMDDVVLRPAIGRVALAADAPCGADRREVRLAADLTGEIAVGDRLLIQQTDTGDPRRDPTAVVAGEWIVVASIAFGAVTTMTTSAAVIGDYSALGDPASGVAPARVYGNAVRATHGTSQVIKAYGTGLPGQAIELELAPLTQVGATDGSDAVAKALSVSVLGVPWVEVEDFIDSEAADLHYRVTRDNAGNATVHFGDDDHGAAPADRVAIVVRYRAGNGLAGQVAAERLVRVVPDRFPDASQRIARVRNPSASTGARDAQSLASARLLGPSQLRTQRRAVVPADYEACIAEGVLVNGVRVTPVRSRARFRQTGSWSTVYVSVDLPDRRGLAATPGLRQAFEALLDERKMAGIDVRVEDARYCPVHIALVVEVADGHFARDVRAAVESALIGGFGTDAFFAPGRLGFGQAVHLSDLYAVVAAIDGVASVAVTRFKRLGDRYPDSESAGAVPVGAFEVARCDNDATDPSRGLLIVRACGGKQG